jgi:hypothetical protein
LSCAVGRTTSTKRTCSAGSRSFCVSARQPTPACNSVRSGPSCRRIRARRQRSGQLDSRRRRAAVRTPSQSLSHR